MNTTKMLSQPVIVFSQNYLPISRVTIRRAIILLVKGKAEPMDLISSPSWEIRSPRLLLQIPAYIRLTINSAERIWQAPPVNRREVLRRDKSQCQYCGSKKRLTLDHVIPRCQGGKHTWDNVVTACESCNSRKSDRTPPEAGMRLKTQPQAPSHPALAFAEEFWRAQSAKPALTGDTNGC